MTIEVGTISTQIIDSTTPGRALLTAANAAAQRTALGLGTAALSATGAFDAAGSAAAAAAASQPVDAQLTSLAGLAYAGNSLKVARVNVGETAFELASIAASIGGTLGATDNALIRADGTGAATAQGSALTATDAGVLTTAGIVAGGNAGTSDNPAIKIDNLSSVSPILKWNTTDSLLGLRLYSGSTELARFQDNGFFIITALATLGGLRIGDFYVQRGTFHKVDFGAGGEPAFHFNDGSGIAFSEYVKLTVPAADIEALVLQGAAARTVPLLQLRTSAGASLGNVGGTIGDDFVNAGNVDATGETDLFSKTTVANTFAINGDAAWWTIGGVFANALTAAERLRVYVGGTLVWDSAAFTIAALTDWGVDVLVERVSSTVLRCMTKLTTTGASGAVYAKYTEVTGLTLTSTNVIKITGTSTGVGKANNDIVAKQSKMLLLPAA